MNFIKKILLGIFARSKKNTNQTIETEIASGTGILTINIDKGVALDLDRMARNTGCENQRGLMISMIALVRWVLKKLDQGYVIGALDPTSGDFTALSVANIFPNLAATADQDMESTEDAPANSPRDKITRLAIEHYQWSLDQMKAGARVGALSSGNFIASPVFKR